MVAGPGLQAILVLGVGYGGVHLGLLVTRQVVGQPPLHLLHRLADAGHIAVPKDAPQPGEERHLATVPAHPLHGEKLQ